MEVRTNAPPPVMVISVENRPDGVGIYATLGGQEQEIIVLKAEGAPDKRVLTGYTLKLDAGFPADTDAHGHLNVMMKA